MMRFSIDRNQLKWLAIVAMTIDHIAWAFVPTYSVLGFAMHFAGRITGPVMAYMLYEGYTHTHNLQKYIMRMGIFALVSWVPCTLFEKNIWPYPYLGVIYTLFLGLVAMWVSERNAWNPLLKEVVIGALILLSVCGDWAFYDVICPLLLVSARTDEERKRRFAVFTMIYGIMSVVTSAVDGTAVEWFHLGVALPILLICFCYNGKLQKNAVRWKNAWNKWFFYVYYPAHLLVLWGLKRFL